ncbi:MAG: hypothetical protein HYU56_00815 [Candidatus Aenigmarchaeota archaeon]|nr:hypothetical protein [Candidatus Aenigmarchaeota archaeon]
MFSSKDEHVKKLEKGIENLEKKMNRNFMRINDSLQTITDVITKMQEENKGLKNDRDFLIEKHKEIMRSVETESRLVKEMKEKLVEPARKELKEDVELFRTAVGEAFSHGKKEELFDMVMKSGKVKMRDAARKLNVHEMQIETWAQDMEKSGLIDVFEAGRDTEIRKKSR